MQSEADLRCLLTRSYSCALLLSSRPPSSSLPSSAPRSASLSSLACRFISCPLPSIKRDLAGLISKSDEDLLVLEPQEKYLEREIQAIDKTMEEMADDQDQKRGGGGK